MYTTYQATNDNYLLVPRALAILRNGGNVMLFPGGRALVCNRGGTVKKCLYPRDVARVLTACRLVQSWPSHSLYVMR